MCSALYGTLRIKLSNYTHSAWNAFRITTYTTNDKTFKGEKFHDLLGSLMM